MYSILVVDDEKEIRDAIEIYLRGENYKVYKAGDGIEALDDATVVELVSDEKIKVVDGNHSNYKISTKEDVN